VKVARDGTCIFLAAAFLVAGAALSPSSPARADNCIQDVWYNGDAPGRYIFPNWQRAYMGSYTLWFFPNNLTPEYISGLTVVNFGDAMQGTEISNVYIRLYCNKTDTGTITMTYVGNRTFDGGGGSTTTYPAWTWGGNATNNFADCADYCADNPTCGGYLTMQLYADIASCPAQGTVVNLGFPSAYYLNPGYPGSVYDSVGCVGPWYEVDTSRGADYDTIVWSYKVGPEEVGPGDTVNYTIWFGRPGTGDLSFIDVTDTLPMYMHYLMGSGSPAPAPGWDPDPGPPVRLKWSYGSTPTAGGPTNMITFAATVDWGNTESFEPGSGDIAAPEAYRLRNSAQVAFGTTCAVKSAVTEPAITVVKRFLFWKLGDNDMLFASSMGKPDDEMIYSIFMKNISSTKTWWNVTVWDTVPAEVDVWGPDAGMEDPCIGWTMTPTGCAAASAGRIITAAKNTILTWHLDMPPQYTLTVRWKARLRPAVSAGSTVINRTSIQGMGRVAVVNGTGNTGVARNFTHLALVKLRTTYTSYVSYAATGGKSCPGMMLDFFPLNKATQFELRGIQYAGAGSWAQFGGVSQSIGCIIGDCVNGFPGNAACTLGYGVTALPPGNTILGGPATGAGCKAERVPAYYIPSGWVGTCPASPFNFIYKITSNSPVLWQMLTLFDNCNQDRHTYMPSSNLTYSGYMLYGWRGNYTNGSSFGIINTDSNYGTTVHCFRYDYTISDWLYQRTFELEKESLASYMGCQACGDWAPWRIISSDTVLIVHQGEYAYNTSGCCCCSGSDNHGTFAPTRETGYVTGAAGATFYGIVEPQGCGTNNGLLLVQWAQTMGTPCDFEMFTYSPDSTVGAANIPPLLRGTSGTWTSKGTWTLDPGLAVTANNPIIFNGAPLKRGGSNLFKVRVLSGGPISMNHGTDMYSIWSGGAVIHSWDTAGSRASPTGSQFWLSYTVGRNDCGINAAQFFTPETGVRIGMYSNDAASAEYTTNGTDQCVLFRALTFLSTKTQTRRNLVFVDKTAGTAMMGLYQQCEPTEKGFTAPFLSTGTYYDVIAPPTAFIGEEFWITIVVRSELGGVVTTYSGTTSFSSTDPAAKVEGTAMDTYNYTWNSSSDKGIHIFFRVSFTKIGMQTLVASDTMDGSIVGLAAIMIVGVDVQFFKEPRLSTAASGDTVNFKICWSNYSSASALSFVITDAVPKGTTYTAQVASNHICGTTSAIAYDFAYSTAQSSSPPAAASWTTTTGTPAGSVYWLRWTIKSVGIDTTGCACFKVKVN
jgi:uncharacterized repeat protein (TIGR01451 family)